jgi:hypothetical protein
MEQNNSSSSDDFSYLKDEEMEKEPPPPLSSSDEEADNLSLGIKQEKLEESSDGEEEEKDQASSSTPTPSPNKRLKRGETAANSIINLITDNEVKATVDFYKRTYNFKIVGAHGCEIMGNKKKPPRVRNGRQPANNPLARKKDGYLQVTLQLSSERNRVLFFDKKDPGKKQKVLWHALYWRYNNPGRLIETGNQIAHRCPHKDCGKHTYSVPRNINEEHKKCSYVYFEDEHNNKKVFLKCIHNPLCKPALNAIELHDVTDEFADKVNFIPYTHFSQPSQNTGGDL